MLNHNWIRFLSDSDFGLEIEAESLALLTEEISERVEKWKGISFSELSNRYIPVVLDYLLRILLAVLIFVIGRKLIRWLANLLDPVLKRHGIELTIRKFLENVFMAAGYLFLFNILLQTVGLTVTSITAVVASLGVGIGLAMQGSLANFAGGLLILATKPFVIGDYIIQGTNEGTVKEIGLVYTRLCTIDNRMILIPNGALADSSIINVSAHPTRRLDLTVGISYKADLKLAKDILQKLAMEEKNRILDEDIQVCVDSLSDSAVVLGLKLWVPTDKYWETRFRLTEQIKLALDEAEIEIPYKQVDVHIN